jgi:hypothetical protein
MADQSVRQSDFPGIEAILNLVAQWAGLCRLHGKPPVMRGPGTPVLLQKMLAAVGAAPDASMLKDPAILAELERLCASCGEKARCERELADGTVAENFHAYCPNAVALDSIYIETVFRRPPAGRA